MHGNEVARMLGGSIAIYVVMAACGAGGGSPTAASGDGGGASSGAVGDGSGSGSLLDVLTDPVSEAQADPNQSGTRLKLNYYAGADGSKQVAASMHDTMLNVDCYFQTAVDGTTRCLPLGTATNYYSDANCTQPLAVVSTSAGTVTPQYVTAQIGLPSYPPPTATHYFPLGGKTSVGTGYQATLTYVAGDGGTCNTGAYVYECTAVTPSAWGCLEANSTVYAPSAETPPSAFVQATTQTE